ncbi:MAG: UvrD-helicase domain-containing protein, partial [Lachnospiraceae bacterium]|nr:UvrD-helicase domain-containing protein [Lachnospiraceae bacterium]
VITNRIAYLIHEKNINPREILAITFTNKAANEMLKRVEEQIGIWMQEEYGSTPSTLHVYESYECTVT